MRWASKSGGRCNFRVKWQHNIYGGEDAVLYNARGQSINSINVPRGYRMTATRKAAAERKLLASRCKPTR